MVELLAATVLGIVIGVICDRIIAFVQALRREPHADNDDLEPWEPIGAPANRVVDRLEAMRRAPYYRHEGEPRDH